MTAPIESLPQELIDYIVGLLSLSHGTKDLDALSRVSKAWRAQLQPRLFNQLTLDVIKMKKIYGSIIPSPTYTVASKDQSTFSFSHYAHRLVALVKTHPKIPRPTDTIASEEQSVPFSYVRRLIVYGGGIVYPEEHIAYLEILWLFTKVTDLQIRGWNFQPFKSSDITKWFEHFGGTVRTLGIYGCWSNSAVLIFLKSLFPSVDDLSMHPKYTGVHKYRIQDSDGTKSVKFRGKLSFKYLDKRYDGFLAFVSKNCDDVHSITLGDCASAGTQELFDRCQAGLTSVGYGTCDPGRECIHVCHPTSLHHSSHNCAP